MKSNNLFKDLQKLEDFESRGTGANPQEISHVENVLNVKLPKEYVEFLKIFSYVSSSPMDIFGVSDNEDEDVIYQTVWARNQKLPIEFTALPLDGLVIREYSGGGYYFLYAEDSPRSGEVSLKLDETFYREDSKWNSFNEYLGSILGFINSEG